MENKINIEELESLFWGYGLKTLVEDISDDGDGEIKLTKEGEKFVGELMKLLGEEELIY